MALITARFALKTSSLLPVLSSTQPQIQKQNILQSKLTGQDRTYYTYVNEPSHPIPGKKPKTVSAQEAVSVVKSGMEAKYLLLDNHIFYHDPFSSYSVDIKPCAFMIERVMCVCYD